MFYYGPLLFSPILSFPSCECSTGERQIIFSNLDELLMIHRELDNTFKAAIASSSTRTIDNVGHIMVRWAPKLRILGPYCANITYAKHTLNQVLCRKDEEKDFGLKNYLETAATLRGMRRQRLDDLLDLPRRRIQRSQPTYPLSPYDHQELSCIQRMPFFTILLYMQKLLLFQEPMNSLVHITLKIVRSGTHYS